MKSPISQPCARFSALFFLVLFLLFATSVFAAVPGKEMEKVSWKITAKSVSFDQKQSLYIARDQVIITGGETRLEADYVEFSDQTKEAFAKGNVLLVAGEDAITCKEMQFNLATEIGTIQQGNIFIQKDNFHIKGDTIRKTGKATYAIQDGAITTCDGDNPDWQITGKDIEVTIEGYGFAKHTILWAKKVPTLYSPFLAFPVKTKRQTGLLAPRFGTSDRLGFEYDQPLFLALSRDTDATISADYMSDRGLKIGTQYRYVLTPKSKGTLYFDYLDDDKIDDGTDATQQYRFDSTPQRTNTDRYWFRMKADQELPWDFTAKLDIDWVSDADYLQEFKDGITGYNATKDEFSEFFGRDLDSYDDTTRKNSLMLNKSWDHYALGIQAIWYDNVNARKDDSLSDTTLQTLPEISFDAARQQIGESSFYYTLESDVTAFYRKDTTNTDPAKVSGQRLDIYPKLYRPTRIGKSFYLNPYLGTRNTTWRTDDFVDSDGKDDSLRNRFIIDTGVDFYFKLKKVFVPNFGFAQKIQHELIPKLTYQYIPEVNQDDLPSFTSIDRITETNKLTWTLSNNFVGKTLAVGDNGQELPVYRNLLWFELAQDYNLRDEDDLHADATNVWSDIRFKLEIYPMEYLSLDSEVHWNPYNAHFTRTDLGASLKNSRGDMLSTTYKYTKGNAHTWKTRLDFVLTRSMDLYYSFEKNLDTDKNVETIAGMLYKRPCWDMALEIKEDSSNDKSIGIMIVLKGIGGFGNI